MTLKNLNPRKLLCALINRLVGHFRLWQRGTFGKLTVSIDLESEAYCVMNTYRCVMYVEQSGTVESGQTIPLPKQCKDATTIYA